MLLRHASSLNSSVVTEDFGDGHLGVSFGGQVAERSDVLPSV